MKKIIAITNKNIILLTPLILYSMFSSIYTIVSFNGGNFLNIVLTVLLLLLMTVTFIAGWFFMVKRAVINTDYEQENLTWKLFPEGVGEYFLSSLGVVCILCFLTVVIFFISYIIGMNTIGNPNVSVEALSNSMKDVNALKLFISNLSHEQLVKINLWNMLLFFATTVVYFVSFLFLPAVFFKNKNSVVAFIMSLKELFSKSFFRTCRLFLLILILNFILSIFSAIFSFNILLNFVITLLGFYFITAVAIAVFDYYYNNFVKTKIGQNVDIKV